MPIIETKGFFVKIVWFYETNGVTLHIGTNNSILTKNGVIAFWNWALHIYSYQWLQMHLPFQTFLKLFLEHAPSTKY